MRVFITACIAAAVIAIIGALALSSIPDTDVRSAFSSASGVRI